MVFKLTEKTLILQRLYRDCVRYVEEISLIEEDYLWQNVSIYVDDPRSIQDFLVLREGRSVSVYMTAENPSIVSRFAGILKTKRDLKMHLQTSIDGILR